MTMAGLGLPFLFLILVSCQTATLVTETKQRDSLKIEAFLSIPSSEYKTLKQRRKFYNKAHKLFADYGYEVQWLDVATGTVRILELAHSRFGGFFANTNAEIRAFFNEGNKIILDDMLPKIREMWRANRILRNDEALMWDAQMLSDEQDLIDPYYERMSIESQKILDKNLKRWISTQVFGNPSFNGFILKQEARWEFGMKKMGYCVNQNMMPIPNNSWKSVKLKIKNISKKGKIKIVE